MPETTYNVRINHREDGWEEFVDLRFDEAERIYDMFSEKDADIYSEKQLTAYNWKVKEETVLKSMVF